jgi:FkbM family methyltransferase
LEVSVLKSIARRLPDTARGYLQRAYYRHQLGRGAFRSPEPEWDQLAQWLGPGDAALDVGANVGHYTARMSELVGPAGRVIAIEPVAETFALLAANVQHFRFRNVTLLNLAASDEPTSCRFSVPTWPDGTPNRYLAHVDPDGPISCLAIRLDALELPVPIRLVKIDAEGHELRVLAGMRGLLERDRPVVILERNWEAEDLLASLGYTLRSSASRSPNVVALPS